MPKKSTHLSIDYIEWTGSDLPATQAFFEAVFAWEFQSYGPTYISFKGKRLTGGFEQGDATAGGALVVLYSDNLEETLAAVEAAGGVILKAIFAFPGGRRFEFKEPSGNRLAVWAL